MTLADLLPTGTRLITHWMAWFGQSGHKDVGYNSADHSVIASQCDKMAALGITGVVPDWYGFDPSQTHINLASLRMLDECERRGMGYAICIDGGAIKPYAANPTPGVISLVNYVLETFAISDSYLKVNNRPLIFFFSDSGYMIDWNAVRAGMTRDAALIFRNKSGYTHTQSDGAFSWLSTTHDANDPASLAYLYDFYSHPVAGKIMIGSVYPGFYDPNPKDPTKSVWDITAPVRVIDRRNGVTMLDTFAAVPAGLPFVQLVTWNDHEEGSAIEFGLDNFVHKVLA